MYKTHCLGTIAPAMRADMTVFRRGVMFAVCSIRQATINVPGQIAILFDGEEDENPLFGHKFDAWAYIMEDKFCAQIWRQLTALYPNAHCAWACRDAITELLRVPGLGIVKSAFIAQLMGFDVACLDARNITREKRNPRAYRTDGKSPYELRHKVGAYVSETFGRAEYYWDAWCADVATAYKLEPEAVSALHLAIIPPNYVPF